MGESARSNAGQQRFTALQHANRVRLARAKLKRRIANDDISAAEVVLTCPWEAHSMSISDLLMSQKRWGQSRCKRLLMTIGVPENKTVGSLTERQRHALAGMLAQLAGRSAPMRSARALSIA